MTSVSREVSLDGGDANFVTHQGCPLPSLDAPLPPCKQASESEPVGAPAIAVQIPAAHCWRCAAALLPWVRQGFLRGGRTSRWPARMPEPCP